MAIQELEEAALLDRIQQNGGQAGVFFFTPLCGTCMVGERMLEIAEATGVKTPLYKININYAPKLRDQWQIASVPCLVVLEGGSPVRKEYAMQSAQHLYSLLR
jgi:thioredoxin-like negative regulator of GroEL